MSTQTLEQRTQNIAKILDEKKAENIQIIDLRGKEYITDFVIIATALIGKHSFSLLDTLKTQLKAQGGVFYSTEEESEDWVIADLGEIMIHIFTKEHRTKFNLEEFLNTLGQNQDFQ